MIPAIGLGGEKQLAFDRPEKFWFPCCHVRKDAAGLVGLGREDGACGVGGEVEELDGPGVGADEVRRVCGLASEGRAEPGDGFAVGREDRCEVVAGGGGGEGELVGGEI